MTTRLTTRLLFLVCALAVFSKVGTDFLTHDGTLVSNESKFLRLLLSDDQESRVGKIDVSHFAGLKPGDTPERVVALYGPATKDGGIQKWYIGNTVRIDYVDGGVENVEILTAGLRRVRERVGADTLLDFTGHTKEEVVRFLGPPEFSWPRNSGYILYWSFPVDGKPVPPGSPLGILTGQTLALEFTPRDGCVRIAINWSPYP